jgi:hypothetical protein
LSFHDFLIDFEKLLSNQVLQTIFDLVSTYILAGIGILLFVVAIILVGEAYRKLKK